MEIFFICTYVVNRKYYLIFNFIQIQVYNYANSKLIIVTHDSVPINGYKETFLVEFAIITRE